MKIRPSLLATVAALCIAAGAGRAQYVEDSIDVGGRGVEGLAYNSREGVMYGVAHYGGFFVITCDSNKVTRRFSLCYPLRIVYDSTDNKAYCTQDSINSLVVVDGATHTRTRSLAVHGMATTPVWDPVSDRLYVSCQSTNEVAVLDCVTDSLLKYVSVGACPIKMYTNTLRHKLYVLNADDGTVSIVDMNTNQVIKTVAAGGATVGYYSRRADKFYCDGDDEIVAIDCSSDSVVARPRVSEHGGASAIAGNDSRGIVLASVYDSCNRFVAIDGTVDSIVAVTGAGDVVYAICCSAASDRFYCASYYTSEVLVISGDGRQLLTTFRVGGGPIVIAQSTVQKRLYVGHTSSMVYVIRDANTAWPEGQPSKPDTASGLQLDPSPFRDRLSIVSGTKVEAGVVRVFSEDGRLVRSLNAPKSAGHVLRLAWDGRDNSGALLPPGVYMLEAGPDIRAKVVKLK